MRTNKQNGVEENDQDQDNKDAPWAASNKKYFDIHPPVFWPATILIVTFITVTLLVGEPMEEVFNSIQQSISSSAGWFFVLLVNLFLVFMLYIGLSRFGDIRIGGRKAKPEFTTLGWFAMLFSAGMGIGIIFWSVGEPISHYVSPPYGEPRTPEAAEHAMNFSFLHWGLHAWGIYALVGLSLAFFAFNRRLPLSIRSVFYPLIGNRVYGRIGDIIDVVAVLATLFGLATSLGFGVTQINSGFAYLFGIPNDTATQVTLILLITLAATGSVILGIDKGVRFLSEWNLRIAGLFLIFIIIIGPTLFILDGFVQNTGNYLQSFFFLSYWTETYQQGEWQNNWTVFYWSWWISWAPFVGMFIARVSYGRTIRQFVLGVLIVPSLLTFLWFSAFGGSALFLEINGDAGIAQAVEEDVSTAMFQLLDNFPLSGISSAIGVALVMIFFVTSSDSGSLVVDSITSGGKTDAPVGQRIFWALTEGAVAAVLLIGGGLGALQTATITTGLPFAVLLVIMCYSLYQGLNNEHEKKVDDEESMRENYHRKLIRHEMKRQGVKEEVD